MAERGEAELGEALQAMAIATRKLIDACEAAGGRVLTPGAMTGFSLAVYAEVYKVRIEARGDNQPDRDQIQAHLDRIDALLSRVDGDPVVFGDRLFERGLAQSA